MADAVLYEVSDAIATVTLNRPERLNAWNGDIGHLYWTYLDQAAAGPEVKVIIVTGAGRWVLLRGRHGCAAGHREPLG